MPSANAILKAGDLSIERGLHTLSNGEQYFCQVMRCTTREPSYILVFLHGYTSHGDIYLEAMSMIARAGGLVVLPDLPGHGRSDGILADIPDWWAWVDKIWELLDIVVPRVKASAPGIQKVFVSGMSLGGGLAACLAVHRPNFFNGMVILGPMLGVADDVKPPKLVQDLFRGLLGPFNLSWPVAPSKDLAAVDFRVPEHGIEFCHGNPLSMQGHKPRLRTALSLAFTYPEWMETRMAEMRIPFLVLHGKSDKVTDPSLSQMLFEKAKSTDKNIKLYDGCYHCEVICCLPGARELIGGKEWLPEQAKQTEEALKDMSEWLSARA